MYFFFVYACECVCVCVHVCMHREFTHVRTQTRTHRLHGLAQPNGDAVIGALCQQHCQIPSLHGPQGRVSLCLCVSLSPLSPPLSLFSISVSNCLSTYAFRASFVRFAHVYPPTSFANPACTCSRVHAKAHPRMHTQANSSSTTRTTQCVAPWSFVRAHSHGPPPLHLPRRHRQPQRHPRRKSPRRPRRLPPLPPPPHADRYVCVVAAVPVPAGGRVCACAGGCA